MYECVEKEGDHSWGDTGEKETERVATKGGICGPL